MIIIKILGMIYVLAFFFLLLSKFKHKDTLGPM